MSARSLAVPDAYDEGIALSRAGRHLEAIEHFERALAARPTDPRVLFALGNTAAVLGMAKPAEAFYRQVLALDPIRLEALVNLSNILRSNGNFSGAEGLLLPALARDGGAPELWLSLGSVYREIGDYPSAVRHYREAIARRADYPAALVNLADVLCDTGGRAEAGRLYDRALRLDPGNAQARLNRAVLHLLEGDLKKGWRDYAARLKLANKAPVAGHGLAKWSGGPLKRTRLLVTAEQGIGDQVMFASLFPDLLARAAADGGSVILECEPRLVGLFARSFPKATVRAWDIETRSGVVHARYGWLKAAGGANAAVEMGSLPRYLRPSLSSFSKPHAYLAPDSAMKESWRSSFAAMGTAPFIGICWRSGNMAGHRTLQYAPLEGWAAFLSGLPGTIVVAQYDAAESEVAQLEALSGRAILVLRGLNQKTEIDRSCAMLAALDAVVSAPTAVAWQAAALGVTTAKILYDTSWTSFGEAHEPFAPSCLCATPDARGDWTSAFAKAKRLINPQR